MVVRPKGLSIKAFHNTCANGGMKIVRGSGCSEGKVMVRPGASSTSPMIHHSLRPIDRCGQVTACLLAATTDFRTDAAMNVMFCVPGTFLPACLACGYTRL